MQQNVKAFLLAVASGATVYGQTFTKCNPTLTSNCPSDPALARSVFYDFTKGAPADFDVSTGSAPTFDSDGAKFTIAKHGDAPTITSKWYMMFGYYEIVAETAKGTGTVSSIVLQSDDLDEIDWEWLGSDDQHVQTNYYGKGNTEVYNRGETLPQAGNQDGFHTYALDYTADAIVWYIDGKEVRRLTPATADANQYPQTPMQLKIGTWAGGDPAEPKGTIEWAGGVIDYSKGPYTMTVKSVKAIDYSTGKSYSYGDQTGNWQSIKSDGGQINSSGNMNTPTSDAPAAGTAISQASGGAKLDNDPVASGSAPPTVATAQATGNSTVSVPAATKTSSSGSGSTAGSGSSPSTTATHNAAGIISSSIFGTGLVAFLAASLLM